ncbi:MAG: OmpW family protein [Proteobacteria bacterium]|nr:OmpW family protein [Pseudomonadota bacterium]
MMKLKLIASTAMLAAAALAAPAHAEGNADGKWQIKLLGTAVLPSGKVSAVKTDALGLVSGGVVTDTVASDNVAPTVAIEYFFTKNVSLETICCTTAHHVNASAGALKGTELISNVVIVPATFSLKYHMPLGGGIKPYVGAGPSVFIVLADNPSTALKTALPAVTRTKLSSEFGVAVQGGVDIALGHGYGLSLDAKKYWVSTNATVYAATGPVLVTRNKLDPWVLSAGVSFRF